MLGALHDDDVAVAALLRDLERVARRPGRASATAPRWRG